MSSTPRLPTRRRPPPPRERFLTVVFLGPRAPLTPEVLAPLWRLHAGLEPVVARVVWVDRSGRDGGASLSPTYERRAVDPRLSDPGALAEALRGVPPEERIVVAVADARLASWTAEEVETADDYAARVVARFAGVAGRLEGETNLRTRAGVALAATERLDDLGALLGWREASLAIAPFDLRALRRLRDLDVPPGDVSAELVAGLGRARALWARTGGARSIRIAVDRVEMPMAASATARVRVVAEGWIVGVPPVRRLALQIGPWRVPFAVDVDRPDVADRVPYLADVRCGFRFDETLGPLPPGSHDVALVRVDGRRVRRLGAVRVEAPDGPAEEPAASASLRLRRAEIRIVEGRQRLALAGELESHGPVHSLRVDVDGRRAFDVDRRRLEYRERSERWVWTVEEELALEEGEHEIRVVARRGAEELAEVATRIVAPPAVPRAPRIDCPELDRLRRDEPAPVWGALRLAGRLDPAPNGASVVLEVDGVSVAAADVDAAGGFELRAETPAGRSAEIELVATTSAGEVARSGRIDVAVRGARVPESWPSALTTLLGTLGERATPWRWHEPEALARRLGEVAGGRLAEVDLWLRDLVRRVEAARRSPGKVRHDPGPPPERPLRVLFASWEIPCSGHGGGRHLSHLIRALGERHELTVVHPVHPGAEGLSEEIRSSVRELLAVPRGWQAPSPASPREIPDRQLWTFSEALREAIAREAYGGRYDLLDLHGGELAMYLPGDCLPTCVTPLELASRARTTELGAEGPDLERSARRLLDLLAAWRYESAHVADRVGHLVTLTEPEAEAWLPFLPGRTVDVNPIGLDVDAWRYDDASAPAREPASFLFVGAYRHPPNVAAAEEIVDVIAPRLRERLPSATVRLAGPDLPAALVARAANAGVEVLGWVDDLAEWMARSTAFLAPLRHGAGMRVKVLEAMAAGCPVVATALGVAGISGVAGETYLRAESADEFVEAAVALANSSELGGALARAARVAVRSGHGITAQAARREAIWGSVVGGGSAA